MALFAKLPAKGDTGSGPPKSSGNPTWQKLQALPYAKGLSGYGVHDCKQRIDVRYRLYQQLKTDNEQCPSDDLVEEFLTDQPHRTFTGCQIAKPLALDRICVMGPLSGNSCRQSGPRSNAAVARMSAAEKPASARHWRPTGTQSWLSTSQRWKDRAFA